MSTEDTGMIDYDRIAHENYWRPEALFGLCYEYLRPGQRLLDIGTGTGLAAEAFVKAGLEVHGFDNTPEMLAVCRAKDILHDLRAHDLTQTPWPYEDGFFDHALAAGVLHFLPEIEPVLAEVQRVLRPGGTFTFTTKAPPKAAGVGLATEVIQGTTLYLHGPLTVRELLKAHDLLPLKEMHLMAMTGRGTEDEFLAFVALAAAGPE